MSILQKLLTLIRGGATEAGQAVVDRNAIRILDQEIRDAESQLLQSRDDLAKIMAQRSLADRKLGDKARKAGEYEGYIRGALAKGDEGLARDVAAKLAPLEGEIADDRKVVASYDDSIRTLHATIRKTESNLARLKQQVDTVKVNDKVQRAQSAIAARHSGANSKMRTALDSLDRIQQRQLETAARLDAAHQLASSDGDEDLRKRLAGAGLLEGESNADDVLARFRSSAPKSISHDPMQVIEAQVVSEDEYDKQRR